MDETEMGMDVDELELGDYVEHDKKYFFVHSAQIRCKLCSFKGKSIVQHYRTSHPESEVLISRMNPHITKGLIEDSIQNREKYDKDYPEFEKTTCNFKCPFCLMLIKDTTNAYCNHISSHTGEYSFHCNHCSYWTHNQTNIHSHLKQIHYKIQKSKYQMVYLDPKISKYIFGYICSECYFIQMIRTTVEEHAMVYHPGKPEIHRVNLDVLLHDNLIENHLNINCTNTVTSGPFERHNHNLSIPAKIKESSDLLVQIDQLNDVKVKIEPKNLDDDPCPIEQMTFICQSDLDIKQDFENDRTEMLCDRLQLDLATEMIKESEKIQRGNKEHKSTSEEMETFNEEINTPEKLAKTEKSLEVIEIGPISVIKEFNVFTFHCKIPNCNYYSDDKKAFATHCEVIHKDFFYSFDTRKCNICSIKFEYEGKFITVYDVYLHMVTTHKDFFKPESAIKFKLMNGVSNILSQTYYNPGSEIPSIMSNVTSLTSESDPNSCNSPLPLISHITENKEEVLSSEVKLPVITSVELLTPKMEPLVSMSDDDSKCASVQTVLMTDTEKQNRKCPKAMAIMMEPSLLNALYKCPKYDCTFATMLSQSFQKHFATHHSILKDTLVPCLYCDYKVSCSSYVIHLEVRHGHCIFGCGDCFYRTTNSYFVTMHRELVHPNTKFNILQLQGSTSSRISADTSSPNIRELVLPYNCREDGFLSCSFKTLYFNEYLKHVKAVHQIDGLGLFSSEDEPQKEAVIEGWLVKEVGPFQCGYCKKATVTHEEMGRHQAVFHAQEQCLFYYRKFVPNGTVLFPEQVNLEDPSFINHVIHLPNQIHLCNFKLTDGLLSSTSAKLTNGESDVSFPLLPTKDIKSELDQSSVWLDEPEAFNVLVKDEPCVLDESDPLCLDEQPMNDDTHNDAMVAACKLQCKWKGCYQVYHSQTAFAKHIEKNHVELQNGKEFTCFWNNCPRKLKPYTRRAYLLSHMIIHSGEKPHKCPFQDCGKTFSYIASLKIHQKSHTGEKPYVCQFSNCSKSFVTINIRNNHQRMHYDPEAYACRVTGCSKKYTDRSTLYKHMKNHTVDEQLEAKRKLVEKKQNGDDFVLKPSNSLDGAKRQKTHYETLQCKWKGCYQTFDSQTTLVKHLEKNHVQLQSGKEFTCFWINCPRKSKPFNHRYALSIHMRVHNREKPYKCAFQGCNEAFAKTYNLEIHQRRHTGERPYFCQFSKCCKSFFTRYERDCHQRRHRSYACQVTGCSQKYSNLSNLQKHMENHIVDEQLMVKSVENKQKECDFVLKKSSNSSPAVVHKVFEKAEHQSTCYGTLQCKWKGCYQIYHSQTALVKHLEKSHVQLQTGKEFICFWSNCPRKSKPYDKRSHLIIHMRVHSGEKPYKCPFHGCSKAFPTLGTLKAHQKSHTGERPYSCQFSNCLKSFPTNSIRNYHQRLHYDPEAYACRVTGCSRKYTEPSNLRRHMKYHTIEEQFEAKQKSVEKRQREGDFVLKKSSTKLDVGKLNPIGIQS